MVQIVACISLYYMLKIIKILIDEVCLGSILTVSQVWSFVLPKERRGDECRLIFAKWLVIKPKVC